jgi:Arc/MetJ-type ribon-helix-helix transcriptional regulator
MRTTVTIDDDLLRQVKEQAAHSGRTVSEVIEAALRESLSRRRHIAAPRATLPTSPGAPRPGVDLDDSAALLAVMET